MPRQPKRSTEVKQLDALYEKALAAGDYKMALQVHQYRNSLMAKPSPPAPVDQGNKAEPTPADTQAASQAAAQLELIAAYLLPLNLTAANYPIQEHVRIAADLIRANNLAGIPPQAGAV